ncbi:uncharacterized protein LOC119077371 isoform X2 [Bradysia coprophila]|uniref:uncharacterized protein LOC119077371 isoform X2 n=1 Tax=Bradysia coprophila TaxID=38358 RepID=UPI00187DC216|nr:uncharacterized protein LOC119077371 isoform X2 [Bradysia coprophila]
MCTQLSPKVPSINQFLAMTTAEILELPVNKCQSSELYKGIEHQINHPVTNQILALKYFVNRFNSGAERLQLCDIVVPKLKESLCELLQSSQLDTLCSVINSVNLAICDTVDSTCDGPSEVLQSLAIGVLDLLLQLYKLIFERRDNAIESERLNSITGCVNGIRAKLLEHLKSNEANYLPDDLTYNDATFVNRVIVLLCEMAEFAFKAEEATFLVAVWRCIVAICVGKLPKSIERLAAEGDESNCFEYLLSVVKTGCFCIRCGLDGMLESSSERTSKLHSKTIVFITNVFQRLAAVYSHDKFRGHHHILTTLLTMMRTIRTLSPTNALLNQGLVSGLQKVLLLICKCDEFAESFRRISSDEYSIDLLSVGLELSKKLLGDEDSDSVRYFMKNEHSNVIDKMVECLSTDPSSMFDQHHMHQNTIETLSNILIRCSAPTSSVNPDVVPGLLVTKLLQCNNISAGYIWMALWRSWIGCLSEEQCYSLILFWSEVNAKHSTVQSNHLASVHVNVLLRNLYDGLSGSYRAKVSSDKRILSNIKFWTAVGLHRRGCEAREVMDVHTKVDELLKAFLIDRTDAAFYKLIEHLRLLETIPQSKAISVPTYLLELWNLNLIHRPKTYSPLIVTLIRISMAYQRCLNNSQHLQILRKLSAIVNSSSVTIFLQLEVLHYLRHVAINYFSVEHQRDILQLIRQLFNKGFADPDPIVRKAAFIAYVRVFSEANNEDFQLDNVTGDENVKMELFDFMQSRGTNSKRCRAELQIKFLRELGSCSIQHDCNVGVTTSQPNNGSGSDCNSDDIRTKEIIDRMADDAKELIALNRRIRLTDDFCKRIASIRQELALLE